MSLILYGNAILDTIHVVRKLAIGENHECVENWSRAGGVANACRALNGIYPTVPVSSIGNDIIGGLFLKDIAAVAGAGHITVEQQATTSHATIIVDVADASRTSIVARGVSYTRMWTPISLPAKWAHFMYVDNLNMSKSTWKAFRKHADENGIILSGDISGPESNNLFDRIQYLDYLFCDMRYWRTYTEEHVRQGVILHNNCAIMNKSKSKHSEIRITPEVGLNVLGAGDYFAANCIHQLILSNSLDLQAAHKATLQLLHTQTYGNKHFTANSRQR